MKNKYPDISIFVLFLFATLPFYLSGQGIAAQSDSVLVIKPVAVSDIPAEIESFNAREKVIQQNIQPSEEILDLDSTFVEFRKELEEKESEHDLMNYDELNTRETSDLLSKWKGYNSTLLSMRGELNERSQQLQNIFDETSTTKKVWEKTLENARNENVASTLVTSAQEIIDRIDKLISSTKKQQDRVLKIYKEISDEVSMVESVVAKLDKHSKKLKSEIFYPESPPLWASIDSTSNPVFLKNKIVSTVKDNYTTVSKYIYDNRNTAYFQIAFLLALILFFIYMKRTLFIFGINEQNTDEVKASIVLKRPVASALVMGLLISIFFFTIRPPAFNELFLVLYMLPVIVLSQLTLERQFRKYLYLLIGLFILISLESYLYIYTFSNRILQIVYAAITFFVILKLYRQKQLLIANLKPWLAKLVKVVLSVYLFLIPASILGFIIGNVDLSFLLLSSVIKSLIFAIISIITITILSSLLIILTRETKGQPYFMISKYQTLLVKRIKPVIEFLGFGFWVYATLASFDMFKPLMSGIGVVMDVSWTFGKGDDPAVISLGGIISFFVVLLISFTLARVVRVIFADEWIVRSKMPRGIPQAISITVRYMIIGFGIYLALTAAGVNLDKFGLLAGALGVGIGFGLQGVVYNFISGLILSYERPIHVGDTIQLNSLMGRVTEIGVRASKVLTYDGSEVIVPNSELISKQVINWTLSSDARRLKIQVRTSLDADPRVVMKLLREIATNHPNTMPNPEPMILFDGYGDISLDFTVYMWINFNVSFSTRSEVALQIYDAIKEAGYDVPVPQQKIYYTSDDLEKREQIPPAVKGE